jgi:hypothetical protein
MSDQGYNARTDSYVWLCDGPPLLARGMVAAAGSRCGRRLELPRRVLLEVGDQLRARYYAYVEALNRTEVYEPVRFHSPVPWELAQAAVGRDWQMLGGLAAGGIANELETRVLCPDHRLAWDDEEPGRPIKATLDEQLGGSLEELVAATYERLGIPRE